MASPVTNDVLATKLDAVNDRLSKVETKLDAIPVQFGQTFISHEFFDLSMKAMDLKVQANDVAIRKLDSRKTWLNWLLPTISAVLGSLLTFLIINYLSARQYG